MSGKSKEEKERLRVELVELERRINAKIKMICETHQKLPYDRLAAGRDLKETYMLAISYFDKGNQTGLNEFLRYLREKGIKV
ncbi:hypothetical protein [Algoriphagus faecimaris]|nr:hypothetical protein [Algoriphagus faecimaris]